MDEIWKDIPGYESLYLISSKGRILSLRSGNLRKDVKCGHGYRAIELSDANKKKKRHYIHRLVATVFLGSPPADDYVVNHINLNKTDNSVGNLEWCTIQENSHHAYINGKTDFHRVKRCDNTSGVPGVYRHNGGYAVSLCGKYIGWSKNIETAIALRKKAEQEISG